MSLHRALRLAGANGGYWLAGAAFAVALLALIVATRANAPLAREATGTEKRIEVVARELGVAYNVQAFCDDPSTVVLVAAEPDIVGAKYVAQRGTEIVSWRSGATGENPAATHFWVAPDGRQQSESVEVNRPAAACFKKKAR